MKNNLKFFGALALVVGGLAFGAAVNRFESVVHMLGGTYVGPRTYAGTANNVTTRSLATGTLYVNFPFDAGCKATAVTVTGSQVGDNCSVGATTALGFGNAFSCNVTSADTATITQCPAGSDPGDAGYRVRVWSNQ